MEKEKPEEMKRSNIKATFVKILLFLSRFGSFIIVIFFVGFVAYSIIRTFPDSVPISNANNLLQIWITTNGVLMGFSGIIFAQLISSVMHQQNFLIHRIIKEKHNTVHSEELKRMLKYLNYMKTTLSLCITLTLILLAYSILLSMQGIARNSLLSPEDTFSVNDFMSGPLLSSVFGIFLLIFTLILPIKSPLEEALELDL